MQTIQFTIEALESRVELHSGGYARHLHWHWAFTWHNQWHWPGHHFNL